MLLSFTVGWMAVAFTKWVVIWGKWSCWGWKEEMCFGLTGVEVPVTYSCNNIE